MDQLLVQLLLLLLFRNTILKMSIVGILCYYWLNIVATSESQVKFQNHKSLTCSARLGTTWIRDLLQQREAHVVSWEAEFPTLKIFISNLREINCRKK